MLKQSKYSIKKEILWKFGKQRTQDKRRSQSQNQEENMDDLL